MNPDLIGENEYKEKKVTSPTNVVVIGGGPAGLEAACTAAEVGCNTFLFEKEEEVGGLLRLISKFPAKNKINYIVEYFDERIAGLKNLVVFHGKAPTIKEIDELKPDLIINATGSAPSLPPIKGLRENVNKEGSAVYTVTELMKNIDLFTNLDKKKVVVAGGGAVGLDCAEFFAEQGAEVTIVERVSKIGADLDPLTRKYLMSVVEEYGIKVFVDTNIEEVMAKELICSKQDSKITFDFDIALMCLGFRSENNNVDELHHYYHKKKVEFINIGDSSRPRKIGYGIVEGRSIRYTTTLLGKLG